MIKSLVSRSSGKAAEPAPDAGSTHPADNDSPDAANQSGDEGGQKVLVAYRVLARVEEAQSDELGDAGALQKLPVALHERGWSPDEIASVCRENWSRLLDSRLPA